MDKFHISLQDAVQQLKIEKENKSSLILSQGTMKLKIFAPKIIDTQTPHSQDELYIITSGESDFTLENKTVHCVAGDALYAPAGVEHRFKNFTNDFTTWVVFYGPEGGEGGVVNSH